MKFQIWLVEDSEADELLMRQALKLDGMDCEFRVSEDGEKAIDFIDAMDNAADNAAENAMGTDARPHIFF